MVHLSNKEGEAAKETTRRKVRGDRHLFWLRAWDLILLGKSQKIFSCQETTKFAFLEAASDCSVERGQRKEAGAGGRKTRVV